MSDVLLDVITPTEAFWRMLGGNWQTVVLIAVCIVVVAAASLGLVLLMRRRADGSARKGESCAPAKKDGAPGENGGADKGSEAAAGADGSDAGGSDADGSDAGDSDENGGNASGGGEEKK